MKKWILELLEWNYNILIILFILKLIRLIDK
jgi:hypothetical protein